MSDIFIFNPTGEMAIANGLASYMPSKSLMQFEKDLAFLPSFFAADGDIVITPELPDPDFLGQWRRLGLPEMHHADNLALVNRKFNYIKPWSWTPAMHRKTKHLKQCCDALFKQSPNFTWKQGNRDFFSRETTNTVQQYLWQENKHKDFIAVETPALGVTSLDEFNAWFANQDAVILKMPWSSSGRGIHVIDPSKGLRANYQWINGAIKQQGFITAEPLLDKVFDFSFQFNLKQDGELAFTGISYSINDDKQRFIGGSVNWPHRKDEISEFLSPALISEAAKRLIVALRKVEPHHHHEGPIGIDAIVYRSLGGELKIHPCVDINWRYNMGLVNIALPKFVHGGSYGIWKISSFSLGGWNDFVKQNQTSKPLVIADGKIVKGFINMTPPNAKAMFGVWMEVWEKPPLHA